MVRVAFPDLSRGLRAHVAGMTCIVNNTISSTYLFEKIEKGRLKNQLKERLREEQEVVAGALKSTISNRKSESHLHESGR